MSRILPLPFLLAAALPGVGFFAPLHVEPHGADARDLLAWEWRVLPGSSLAAELHRRLPDAAQLQVRDGFVLWMAEDGAAAPVHAALAAIRQAAWARERQQAEGARQSLLADYGERDYERVLIKLTWIGGQSKPVPGLAVHATSQLFALEPFRAFCRQDGAYGNDRMGAFRTFAAPGGEIGALVHAVLDDPAAATALRATTGVWSLSILDASGAHRPNLVELLLDRDQGKALFARMLAAVPDDPTARAVLTDLLRAS